MVAESVQLGHLLMLVLLVTAFALSVLAQDDGLSTASANIATGGADIAGTLPSGNGYGFNGKHCNWLSRSNLYKQELNYSTLVSATAASDVEHYYRGGMSHSGPPRLRMVGAGELCGAATAVCRAGLCCSQTGFCSSSPVACDGTCQCDFSGEDSPCRGTFPLPAPSPVTLAVAAPAGPCGAFLARCPQGQCCTQFGVCQPDDSMYCAEVPTCQPEISSSTSRACRAMMAGLKRRVRRYQLVATEGVRAPDGFPRTVILLNGQFPGPTLTAEVGDRVIITFTNRMANTSASIHMHGMLQRISNTQDGAVPITQRDVPPGGSFVYNYIADAPGTYWYHSHYLTQYTDGLKGNLLITDPTAKKYVAEPVIDLSDWYHVNSSTITTNAINKVFLKPNSTLINGIGQSRSCGNRCKYAMVRGAVSSCSNPRLRLRIINSGGGTIFNVSVDDHRLIVVAADGVSYQGFEVGSLQINAGQRYDVLVCSRKVSGLSRRPVWIRAGMQDQTTADTFALAVLYFTQQPPTSLPTSQAAYEGPALTIGDVSDAVNPNTLQPGVLPPAATRTVRYTISFSEEYLKGVNGLYGHLNNISLQMSPFAPSLLERYSHNPEGLGPPAPINSGLGWHIIPIKEGDVVDVILDNEDAGEHPMHLHGHWFWIVGFGRPFEGAYKGQELRPSVIRDTATIANKSWLAIRFIADNPGSWILHCHIDKHLAMGMGIVFTETL